MSETHSTPPSAKPVQVLAVLLPEAEIDAPADKSPAVPAIETDPLFVLAEAYDVWVDTQLPGEESTTRLELPGRDHADLYELLETLYIFHGWAGVDAVVNGLQRALVVQAALLYPLTAESLQPVRRRATEATHYPLEPRDIAAALEYLIAAAYADDAPRLAEGLRSIIVEDELFSWDRPHAMTEGDALANPAFAARVFAGVMVPLQRARRLLATRVTLALRRVENEARRTILSFLLDARAEIIRETERYFTWGKSSAVSALESRESMSVAPGNAHGTDLAEDPHALREALRAVTSYAKKVVLIDSSRRGTPSSAKPLEEALSRARAILAREVGRHAQAFPVMSQVAEKDIAKAALGGRGVLGGVVFPLLTRAYKANKAMWTRVSDFHSFATESLSARYPEFAAAKAAADAGQGRSVWFFRKYVEKAAAHALGEHDDVGRRAVDGLLDELGVAPARTGEMVVQAAGEMLLTGSVAKFAARAMPVLNVALAAWHVAAAVEDYKHRHDEFYCALDPRDALVDAAPSAAALIVDVTTEAAFAFI